jgi:hypothetical protein
VAVGARGDRGEDGGGDGDSKKARDAHDRVPPGRFRRLVASDEEKLITHR